MSAVSQYIHDKALYASAYLQGRLYALPRGPTELYGVVVSRLTSILALPLPFLSFLVIPFYGGSSTTVSLVVFVSPYTCWEDGLLEEFALLTMSQITVLDLVRTRA